MDYTTFTSDASGKHRFNLPEKLATIRHLLGAVFPPLVSSSDQQQQQQLMDDAAAIAAKNEPKEKGHKQNKDDKAAPKHKTTNFMGWLGCEIISLIMMAIFTSVTMPFVTFSLLIHPSDGSSEGNAPPPLPHFRQRGNLSNNAPPASNRVSSSSSAVVPPPIFSPTAVSSRRMKSDELRASTCLDTPNWKDEYGNGCDMYQDLFHPGSGCPGADIWAGDMGPATKHCCHCGKSHNLPTPTNSSTITNSTTNSTNPLEAPSSPTISGEEPSAPPSKSTLTTNSSSLVSTSTLSCDMKGWYDSWGYDCSWYEAMDDPGCPRYGSQAAHEESQVRGTARDTCCYCKNAVLSTSSPTNTTSSSSAAAACIDTPGWEDIYGNGCKEYEKLFYPGCPGERPDSHEGRMGPASDHCCYCKNPSCEDYRIKCQTDTSSYWDPGNVVMAPFCKEAELFCSEGAVHSIKIITNALHETKEIAGLYNEQKCRFWSRLCEDTIEVGEACDYAAEYCCGDYEVDAGGGFRYLSSPLCYCDFFNYAQNEFGRHVLKPKALNINISKEFENPCGQFEGTLDKVASLRWNWASYEKTNLEEIYKGTKGQNWLINAGWMNDGIDHCQWYGITCNGDGFVTSIDLRGNNLSGQFPVYTRSEVDTYLESDWLKTKYGLANLFYLKTLHFADNKLNGTIDYGPLYNLFSLTHFDVSGNQFTGEVDALVAPSLSHADFSNNLFESMRRFEKYKVSPLQTLRFCDMSNNNIEVDATDVLKNIPSNMEQFIASNNRIGGTLPESLNNLPKLRQFDMSSNALSGGLPGFTESFVSLQEVDLSKQKNGSHFTGSIPENIWRCLSLQKLSLADNMITGSIPTLLGNLAVLEVFDLSDNILTGSIPSEVRMLVGSLKHLGLANNTLTGSIPYQLGQIQGDSVLLRGNTYNSSTTAPLSLCMLRSRSGVKEFDLASDTVLCPIERNALSDFYYSSKGAEWTESTYWLHEYVSYCDWHGVTCDKGRNHVTKLELPNNGLSGRVSDSIGNLTFIKKLDLSDNDIRGSFPTGIGLLSNLTYLRLSYNAFTGAAPKAMGELKQLQLLQLQSNKITKMPKIPRLDETKYGNSAFVIDCDIECKNCTSTMCCTANEDCDPQEITLLAAIGYANYAVMLVVVCIVFGSVIGLFLYFFCSTKLPRERRPEEESWSTLSNIGKDSVYCYIVRDKPLGWVVAFATLGIQISILVFFLQASRASLQDDIEFTWKCPRDSDACDNIAVLTISGWIIFYVIMIAFLGKDMINGFKLIYHSSINRYTIGSRIRYFAGGMGLLSVTLFALYVSIMFNTVIAKSNVAIIINSVIMLFVMEIDEAIFAALNAINDKWTEQSAESEETSEELERQRAQIASQQEQIASQQEQIASQQEQIDKQRNDLRMLRETVEKMMQESQAAAGATSTLSTSISQSRCTAHESMTTHESNDDDTDTEAAQGGTTDDMEDDKAAAALPPDAIVLEIKKEEIIPTQEESSPVAVAVAPDSSDSECEGETKAEV